MKRWTWLFVVGALAGCAAADDAQNPAVAGDAGDTDATAGAGGAMATVTGSSSAAAGGNDNEASGSGGDAGATGEIVVSIGAAGDCRGSLRKVAAAPLESGAIALGRFAAHSLPFEVNEFRYVACDDSAHDVVYFAGGETPDEGASITTVGGVAHPTDETSVKFDPPVALSDETPYLYVGIRMISDGSATTCVVACRPGEDRESNYWSSAPDAPYGWHYLSDDGLEYDYVFSIVGRPL